MKNKFEKKKRPFYLTLNFLMIEVLAAVIGIQSLLEIKVLNIHFQTN